MTIWLLAILLLALFGFLGYAKGAIRTVFPLLGLLLACTLAIPLSPLVRPLVPLVGLANPVWSLLLPPVLVFFLVAIVFLTIGFIVHRQVNLYYKYRTDEHQYARWQHLNKQLGVSLGLVSGVVYTVLVGVAVYIVGYVTVQVSAGDGETGAVKYLNTARADLRSSGLEKTAAVFDPMSPKYYHGADILGLLYHNPILHGRLAAYPGFLVLAERQEFQDIGSDAELQNLLASRATLRQLVENPKAQAVLGNAEIIGLIEQVDLKDLSAYLQTGQSAKYQDQRILGRWQVDPYATLLQMKKKKGRMTTGEMKLLRAQVEFIKNFTLVAAPDNSVKLKGPDITTMMQKFVSDFTKAMAAASTRKTTTVVAQAPTPQPAAPTTGLSSQMARRYGNAGASATPAPVTAVPVVVAGAAPAAAPAPPSVQAMIEEIAKMPSTVLAQGAWSGDGDAYQMKMQAAADGFRFGASKEATVEASIRDGQLFLSQGGETTVFSRY